MTTEGKWSVVEITNKKNRLGLYAVDDDGYPVATVVGEANANLIASSPNMLKALKLLLTEFIKLYEEFDPEGEIAAWGEWRMEAEDAIAKAEGKQTGRK